MRKLNFKFSKLFWFFIVLTFSVSIYFALESNNVKTKIDFCSSHCLLEVNCWGGCSKIWSASLTEFVNYRWSYALKNGYPKELFLIVDKSGKSLMIYGKKKSDKSCSLIKTYPIKKVSAKLDPKLKSVESRRMREFTKCKVWIQILDFT